MIYLNFIYINYLEYLIRSLAYRRYNYQKLESILIIDSTLDLSVLYIINNKYN